MLQVDAEPYVSVGDEQPGNNGEEPTVIVRVEPLFDAGVKSFCILYFQCGFYVQLSAGVFARRLDVLLVH